MKKKSWYKSRTIWGNIIALGGLLGASQMGFNLSGEEVGSILVIINLIFRAITGSALGK